MLTEILSDESRSVDSESVEDWENYQLLQEIDIIMTYIMVMRLVYFSVYNLARHSLFKDTFFLVMQNVNSWLLCSMHAVKM